MTLVDDTTTGATHAWERVIPQPEPGLTVEDFVRRARDMREHLRAEQEATEERTYPSEETHEKLKDGGFYRILLPRTFGGYEMRVSEFFRVIIEVARGCPSTGWCLALGAGNVVDFASLFPADVQAEAVGEDGHLVMPHRVVPSGMAVPHEDGWELNGTWGYCSGAPYSTHALVSIMLPPGEDGAPRIGMALMPRSGYTVLDDWGDTIGMRGSGSHSIRAENLVVPRDHLIDVDPMTLTLDQTVGAALHGNSMYTGRVNGIFWGYVIAVGVGVGRAMLDEYREGLLHKTPMWSPRTLRADDPHYQRWYGEACSLLDAADAVLQQVGELYHSLCERAVRGEGEFGAPEDTRLANLCTRGGQYTAEAMDLLVRTGGASMLRRGTRTERYWRDFSTYRSHAVLMMRDETARNFGAADLEAARQALTPADPGTDTRTDSASDSESDSTTTAVNHGGTKAGTR